MMRGRWRTVCKDVFLVVVGVLIGVCLSQFLKTVQCSSGDSLPFIKIKSKLSSNLNINASSIEHQQQGQDQYQHDLRLKQEEMKTRLNLDKTQFDKTQPRPKYLKEELKIREPLYVGVVTAVSFLNSRAMDINGTWAHKLSKVDYFAAEGQGPHPLSVVSLEGVDDTYPPQKKVYRMLRYMHDNYIDKFNWFLRADDDAYIRVPELLSFLSILDPNVPLYIGSPGLGKPEDLERIKLLPHERYCMGGPGVIFSRALLIQLAPHLDDCLENVVVSYNEDVEVGRCISRKLGIQCTWAYEVSVDSLYTELCAYVF